MTTLSIDQIISAQQAKADAVMKDYRTTVRMNEARRYGKKAEIKDAFVRNAKPETRAFLNEATPEVSKAAETLRQAKEKTRLAKNAEHVDKMSENLAKGLKTTKEKIKARFSDKNSVFKKPYAGSKKGLGETIKDTVKNASGSVWGAIKKHPVIAGAVAVGVVALGYLAFKKPSNEEAVKEAA